MTRPNDRRDEGASLIVVLVLITLVGAIVAALSNLGITAYRTTDAARTTDSEYKAADAALDRFVSSIRSSATAGSVGNCPTSDWSTPVNGKVTRVTCSPGADSGVSTGAASGTVPPYSIQTVGTGASGVTGTNYNGDVSIAGDVAIASSLSVFSGAKSHLYLQRGNLTVGTNGDCSDTSKVFVDSNKSRSCTGVTPADPAIVPATAAAWAAQVAPTATATLPTCGAGTVVTFTPGVYTSSSALSNLTRGGTCANKLLYFPPGTYYFNFANAGAHEWLVDDSTLRLIGGTPIGWNPVTGAGVSSSTPVMGVAATPPCQLQAATEDVDGVQFVFGGDSRWNISNGAVELCPTARAGQQQIAIYAPTTTSLMAGSVGTPAYTGVATSAGMQVNPGTGAVAATEAARTIDSPTTSQTVQADGNPGKVIMWQSTGGFSTGPSNEVITSAVLHIRHQELDGSGTFTVKVNGLDVATTTTGTCTTGFCDTQYTLPPLLYASTSSLSGVTITLTTTFGSANKSSVLDGMRIDVSRAAVAAGGTTLSTYAPASGCMDALTAGTPCPVLTVGGSGGAKNASLYTHGTLYAPRSQVYAALFKQTAPAFTRGVLSWSLSFSSKPNSTFAGVVVSLPAATTLNRNVKLTAFVCDTSFTTCNKRLTATVVFDDAVTPGFKATYTQYSIA